jgi:glycerol-3-phosphate dehydrogenase
MEALLADAEASGAALAVNAMFKGSKAASAGRHLVEVEDVASGQVSRLETRWLINAAGAPDCSRVDLGAAPADVFSMPWSSSGSIRIVHTECCPCAVNAWCEITCMRDPSLAAACTLYCVHCHDTL